jgi:hypothetical protein
VVTDAPNARWSTEATMAWSRNDGRVWVFVLVDHYTDEAWAHVAKVGNRFAALQPACGAVIDRLAGSVRTSSGASSSTATAAAKPDSALQGRAQLAGHRRRRRFRGQAPGQRGGRALHPDPKGAVLWARLHEDTADRRQSVATFIETYNNEWLIEGLEHRTPREAFIEATAQVAG